MRALLWFAGVIAVFVFIGKMVHENSASALVSAAPTKPVEKSKPGDDLIRQALNKPAPAAATNASAPVAAAAEKHATEWNYDTSNDPMNGGVIRTAEIDSANTFNLSFPYAGSQHARLILRSHPRHGRDVILQIQRGQMLCGISDCSIPVRFDEEKATAFTAVNSADHDSTVLFLRNYDRFAQRLAKAKIVRIEPTLYQHGGIPMEFHVAGFDPSQMTGKSKK